MTADCRIGPFELRRRERRLVANGASVSLGSRAFDVLCELVDKAGVVVSKRELFDRVWPGLVVEENNLQVHVSTLRKLLGVDTIATVAGTGYQFTAEVRPLAPPDVTPAVAVQLAGVARSRSIAVLPFANLSADAEQEYFSDGLAEDVIACLTRSSWLVVVARDSSFAARQTWPQATPADIARQLGARYVVTGSVRRAGGLVRISAELQDTDSAESLWSRRFDRPVGDWFELQQTIADSIVGAIEPIYLRREEQRANNRRDAGDMQRWDLLIRARWHFWRSSRDHVRKAAELLKQSLADNPNDAAALSLLAFTHLTVTWAGWTQDARAELGEANRLALKAVSLDEHDAHAHFTLGTALSCVGHMERGIAELERAVDIYPQFAAAAGELGRQLAFSGRTQEAEEYVLRAMDASPQDPHVSLWVRSRAIAAFVDQRYADAVRYAYDAAARRPDWFFNHFLLAACLAAAGDVVAAQLSMAEAERSHPYPWGAMRVGHPFVRDADRIRFLDALALAGWNPDQRR